MRTGIAHLPLHGGKAPKWLFNRMVKLSREIVRFIVIEFGPDEVLNRLSDPVWFQALGALLGFDWHSSGLTTTTLGALKEGIKGIEKELGLFIAGGKGKTALSTPDQILSWGEELAISPEKLVYISRITAKVDSVGLQDGYDLYHHNIIFTKGGNWVVIQQGMNPEKRYARRYHWAKRAALNFVVDPHKAIVSPDKKKVLNMVTKPAIPSQIAQVKLIKENPDYLLRELNRVKELVMPAHHEVYTNFEPKRIYKYLISIHENDPKNYESLMLSPGAGKATIRGLVLLAELLFGAPPSFNDPVRYSFAHGGKDGHPYPVDRIRYDKTIALLREIVNRLKIDQTEKYKALKRLSRMQLE